ncbi:MAG TPA: D-alanyl-D-alanine carboxypeptidase [Xenococcaceae cyanobacterium]|jgi:D-alanyl-D-alanine carboxypeptidase/D-alanyl-D-alanine-endopeptidase (penicillin-binding protein 4)
MLEVIGSSLLGLLWQILGDAPATLEPLELVSWQNTAIFSLPQNQLDPTVNQIIDRYFQTLQQKNINLQTQGFWLQSDWQDLASYQGTTPASAASLTKIATTLAVLGKLGADYQFVTRVYHTGTIQEGILQGDLIVAGNGDPFFVWEEAIAIANSLNQLGIQEIQGNLVVNNKFYMNYQSNSQKAGNLLQQGLDVNLWSSEVSRQFLALPITTPRPQLTIKGKTLVSQKVPPDAKLILMHKSLPLAEILRQMNIYSNNAISQMLADEVGGAAEVARYAAAKAQVPAAEIQLINGSGLGVENRISPRAASRMLFVLDNMLKPDNLEVLDIFPVAGRDRTGTMENRAIPVGTTVKTGTLNQVSALAGFIPLDQERRVWFTIINSGWQIEYFRQQQDQLLQQLTQHWNYTAGELAQEESENQVYLGDPARNIIQ